MTKHKRSGIILIAVTIPLLVLMVVITAFFYYLLNKPRPHPSLSGKLDEIRIEDLQKIQFEISQFYKRESKLPQKLEDLQKQTGGINILDPQTRSEYTYQTLEGGNYKLCADFLTDKQLPYITSSNSKKFNLHPKGNYCLDLNASTSEYYVWPESKNHTFSDRKTATIGINQTFKINDPKIESIKTSAQSYYSNLKSTEDKYTATANFPSGFFSSDTSEWGLITLSPAPVNLTITFKEPTKIRSISSDFTPGCGDLPCLEWSVVGTNSNNYNINLFKGYGGKESGTPDKAEIAVPEAFRQIEISVSVTSSSKPGFLYWKKLNLEYN